MAGFPKRETLTRLLCCRGHCPQMSTSERHRFHFERDRIRWMTGRGWLRQLLAGYLDADPA